MATQGTLLMDKINSGELDSARLESVEALRQIINPFFEEILEVGARIRPLKRNNIQIGWVRGLSLSERKLLANWYSSDVERLIQGFKLATTLSDKDIKNLSGYEFRSLTKLVSEISDSDMSYYPFTSVYSTTSSSESLWSSFGNSLSSFSNRDYKLPDGGSIKLLTSSIHSRLWATICEYRDKAKVRLDMNYSSALVASAFSGKSARPLVSELNRVAKSLETNSDEPWKKLSQSVKRAKEINDGWGHSHEDDSEEGLLREGRGMVEFDKHEQFMEAFYQQQLDVEKRRVENITKKRGGYIGVEDSVSILSEEESREIDRREYEKNIKLQELASRETEEGIRKIETRENRVNSDYVLLDDSPLID